MFFPTRGGGGTAVYGQLKLHTNGNVSISQIPASAPSDRLYIDAGDARGLFIKTDHAHDDWQSIAVSVTKLRTNSYVVLYREKDWFYVGGEGDVIAKSAWLYSDSSMKHQIKLIESPIERLSKLRGVSFYYKRGKQTVLESDSSYLRQYGVIAQEVEQVFPEMVMETADGTKAVAYHQFVPILIEALKEQQSQIERLTLEINELKKKVR